MTLDFGTARNETVWQPEPGNRGTYGLLSSCVITMVLCVWTAVHLNIPEIDEPEIRFLPGWQTCRKIWWLFLGLFAPELVSLAAFEQYRAAQRLSRRMEEALGQEPHCSKWLLSEHGFDLPAN